MNFRTIYDMHHAVLRGLKQIPDDIDLIVGIPRSGLLAANMIALYLNLPLTDLEGLRERRLLGKGKRKVRNYDHNIFEKARRILIVDDCISQGTEIRRAKKLVTESGFGGKAVFAAIYSFPERSNLADLVLEEVTRPMCFQWSCLHSPGIEKFCIDIDGVLCVDATNKEDDDGPNYLKFLKNAKPLFIPTGEVGWLVTCRLEKYRSQTKEWLQRHGVRYRRLVMMDMPNKEAREKSGMHAAFKAKVYRESGAMLFIESSPGLAARIAEESGLPVMSMGTSTIYNRPAHERFDILWQRAEWWVKRIPRAPKKAWSLFNDFVRGKQSA